MGTFTKSSGPESPVKAWDDPCATTVEAASELGAAFVEQWWIEELQLVPGVVWVREFSAEELSLELWPSYLRERIANSSPNPPLGAWSTEEWRNFCGMAWGWLERRNFVLQWHNDYWADWRGKIHSS